MIDSRLAAWGRNSVREPAGFVSSHQKMKIYLIDELDKSV